ncbi:class I SAM-dependent methyltransferase [Chryseotalea sanaruensis]|uniref:Class I SAM-dependent methyltransferase n=1 Tax=Chryseotalea sanaruensis TaxID=2482724 RepID=A0A401UAY2_9BACT|nr:class I SAM-dependent methyltransferase [Chryseotalea sanaruensis]GCC52050.1 class I SAM-dependent methyltransferase [Chryseotalea sanaruensis]
MKAILKKMFPKLVGWRNRLINYAAHYRFKGKSTEQIFETIFKENHWRDSESRSGTGSNKKNTETVIQLVNETLSKFSVQFLLDIPCGDFHWMKHVDLQNTQYLGADIVKELIASNQAQFSTEKIKFEKLNLLNDALPKVDLLFCRDCLVHFSFKDIFKAINNIRDSKATYLMTTTFPNHTNHDILTGDWRPINLQAQPFNFPKPLYVASELFNDDERFADKALAIWRITDVPILQ